MFSLPFFFAPHSSFRASFQSSNGGKVTTGEIYNFAIMAGANLSRWDAPRWSVFANGFYEPLSFNALALIPMPAAYVGSLRRISSPATFSSER